MSSVPRTTFWSPGSAQNVKIRRGELGDWTTKESSKDSRTSSLNAGNAQGWFSTIKSWRSISLRDIWVGTTGLNPFPVLETQRRGFSLSDLLRQPTAEIGRAGCSPATAAENGFSEPCID